MIKIELDASHLRESHAVHEIHNFLERCFQDRPAGADRAESQDRALPQILIATFGNGDVEAVGDLRLDSLQHSSLAFQGVILGEQKVELENPHNHRGGG
jgi:hypothetical protein